MTLIFSYSLYGDYAKYAPPLLSLELEKIRNELSEEVEFRVYSDIKVAQHFIQLLMNHGFNVITRDFEAEKIGGMFARYLPIIEDNNENPVIVRDTDSLIAISEINLIKKWIKSDLEFHIIRSHVLHIYPIMGGLFSVRGAAKRDFREIFKRHRNMTISNSYNADQYFLAKYIYPQLSRASMVDSVRVVYSGEKYWQIPESVDFIGETRFPDMKRNHEKELSTKKWNILILPWWISKISFRRPFNRLLTHIALIRYL